MRFLFEFLMVSGRHAVRVVQCKVREAKGRRSRNELARRSSDRIVYIELWKRHQHGAAAVDIEYFDDHDVG